MKRLISFAWLAFAGLVLTMGHALADDPIKIGFVDSARVLRDAPPAKAAQQKLEQEFGKREKELQDMGQRLRQLTERLERDAAVTPESERNRRQREATELDRELQRKQAAFREDLEQRRGEELSQVVEKANRVIRDIATQEKYDLILSDRVVAVSPRVDITERVIQAMANVK